MDKIAIGKLIKERLKSLKKSQSDVCIGICDISTYSRIERGLVDTKDDTLIHLFERLGLPTEVLSISIDEHDEAIRQVIRQASQACVHGKRDQALALLESISNEYEGLTSANKQRYDTVDTMIAYEDGTITNKDRLTNMEKAMRLTNPSYSVDNLPTLMTDVEALILRYIANSYAVAEDYNIAISIYYRLKSVEDNKVDKYTASKKLVHICYNLSKCLGEVGRYDECIDVAKEGTLCCEYTDNICMIPSCMYNCIWALVRRDMLGDKEEAKRLIDELSGLYTSKTWNLGGIKAGINDILNTYYIHSSPSSPSSTG
ncbi:MAG: helix-turn-helix domain-containing protein [Oscillospiraceae bacterium]|nr:helix-turn-helix domain-containing protein [Oscillospiraceae bacterium]